MPLPTKKSSTKIQLDGIIQTAKRLPWILGRRAFWFVVFLIVVDVIIGQWIFYRYVVSPKNTPDEQTMGAVIFKESVYQVLLKQRQDRLRELPVSIGTYGDPFK